MLLKLLLTVYLDSKLSTVKHLILKLWSSKLNNVGDIELDPKNSIATLGTRKKGWITEITLI